MNLPDKELSQVDLNKLNKLGISYQEFLQMADRLRKRREEFGWTQQQVAEFCGWKYQGRVGHYENARRVPSLHSIKLMAKSLQTTVSYLIHGLDAIYDSPSSNDSISGTHEIAIVTLTEAAHWEGIMEEIIKNPERKKIEVPFDISKRCYCFIIEGDAMSAPSNSPYTFSHGEYVIIDPDLEPKPGSFVVAKLNTSPKLIFKQLIEDAGSYYLKSLNPQYNSLIKIDGTVKIQGVSVRKLLDLPH